MGLGLPGEIHLGLEEPLPSRTVQGGTWVRSGGWHEPLRQEAWDSLHIQGLRDRWRRASER